MARSMTATIHQDGAVVSGAEDTSVAEIPVPEQFVGKTIRALDIRRNFGVSILMIKDSSAGGKEELHTTPGADYTFQADDVMLVMGSAEELRRLKELRFHE